MTKVLEDLIERVAALPKEAQEEVVRSVVEIEQRHTGVYMLDDEERADILAALEEVKQGVVASDDEAAAQRSLSALKDEGSLQSACPCSARRDS